MEIQRLEQELSQAEQLLVNCESEIARLEGLIAHLEAGGGSQIYDSAPPPIFEESEYRAQQREHYSPEIFQKSGQDFLESFKTKLNQQNLLLPDLIKNYEKALAAYQKAVESQNNKK